MNSCSRRVLAAQLLAATVLSGCASEPVQQFTPPPPPPPEAFSTASKKSAGEQVAAIHGYCLNAAMQQCPGATIRCEAFRRSYVKSCLLKANVPPSYIAALAN